MPELSPYLTRKLHRVANYHNNVHGWILVDCVACAGSGYYDDTDKWGNTPKCSSCGGTGKERVPGPKSK